MGGPPGPAGIPMVPSPAGFPMPPIAYDAQNPFFKTQPCPLYMQGMCQNGTGCFYAHSPNELRPAPGAMMMQQMAFMLGKDKKKKKEKKKEKKSKKLQTSSS